MTSFVLDRSDVRTMLWHLALYGLAAILEDDGVRSLRLSWTSGMQPRARIDGDDLTEDQVARAVLDHASAAVDADSWVMQDVLVAGTRRGLMSPRLSTLSDEERQEVQRRRHAALDALAQRSRGLDLRLVAALGEPAYWSRNPKGVLLQDDGASRLEMQPRNQGSEFVGSRLRKLAKAVAARTPAAVADGLTGRVVRDEAERDKIDSRTPTGFASPGPTDNAVAWCALWGISQLPTVPRVGGTAATSGHLGRGRQEWFYLPVWSGRWRPARLRSVLAAEHLRTAAREGLLDPWAAEDARLLVARAWLSTRSVTGVVRFPITRFGSDSAPERRAMLGTTLRTAVP